MVCKHVVQCCDSCQKINEWCHDCRRETSNKNVAITERGKRYNLRNPDQTSVLVFRMDGGIVHSEKNIDKCDYLYVVKKNQTVIFVELKGRDIYHALKQLISSMSMFAGDFSGLTILARIVCRSVPRITNDKDIIGFRKEIKKKFDASLKISEINMEDSL